ncbi:GFA family protein [Aestuariibacter salexigens]|uniref:GFA family protein n=1 Tax=Aestuariibacter salexigens TaxID=226010 RepID=UPI000416A91A|nr:GFA family protein [Aestuariibacter salexigens]
MKYEGSCHCGRVTFSVEAPEHLDVDQCNCSICRKSGYLHLIVPLQRFTLLRGEDALETYTFNSGIARHTFCRHCGVKPFYTPRSNPDGIDINVNCIDTPIADMTVTAFDGSNWEKNAHKLAHKSKAT